MEGLRDKPMSEVTMRDLLALALFIGRYVTGTSIAGALSSAYATADALLGTQGP